MPASTFPSDILAALNDHSSGSRAPMSPSADLAEARSKVLTVEDVERLRLEHGRELAPEPLPPEPLVSEYDFDSDDRFAAWLASRRGR